MNRRSFIQRAVLTAGAFAASPLLGQTNVSNITPNAKKLRCVQIGCGERGKYHLSWLVKENVVAIVDPDAKRHEVIRKYLKENGQDTAKLKIFTDYRKMFDKMSKEIDLVTIATPNHHHAAAATLAMQHDVGVFCEKPLCRDIAEARQLRELSHQCKSPTQMGNQGHCQEGYIRLCELINAGVIGKITETHSWTDRANGGVGPRPPSTPAPAGLNWDEWIGPAPYRDYHKDIHPHQWHGWYDFGNGSLGNMGCHILDGVYWALRVESPESIEMEEVIGGSDERYPLGSRIRFDIPARGDLPAFKAYWYEGLKKGAPLDAFGGKLHAATSNNRNLPPLLAELQKQYPDEEFGDNGTLYIGEKGILYTGCYGEKLRLVPIEKMDSLPQIPKTLPRPKNVMENIFDACRSRQKETAAAFDYGARLTEFILLGNLVQHAGIGKKLQWDAANMKVANAPESSQWIKRDYRKGWSV